MYLVITRGLSNVLFYLKHQFYNMTFTLHNHITRQSIMTKTLHYVQYTMKEDGNGEEDNYWWGMLSIL